MTIVINVNGIDMWNNTVSNVDIENDVDIVEIERLRDEARDFIRANKI